MTNLHHKALAVFPHVFYIFSHIEKDGAHGLVRFLVAAHIDSQLTCLGSGF